MPVSGSLLKFRPVIGSKACSGSVGSRCSTSNGRICAPVSVPKVPRSPSTTMGPPRISPDSSRNISHKGGAFTGRGVDPHAGLRVSIEISSCDWIEGVLWVSRVALQHIERAYLCAGQRAESTPITLNDDGAARISTTSYLRRGRRPKQGRNDKENDGKAYKDHGLSQVEKALVFTDHYNGPTFAIESIARGSRIFDENSPDERAARGSKHSPWANCSSTMVWVVTFP